MVYQTEHNSISGWYFTEDEIRNAIEGDIILNPSIDLTNACNLNCPYCYIEEKNSERKVRKPNELTFNESITIIDDLHKAGAKTINIVGAGEPTIDPHFEEIIKYIHSKGITTVLFTNGIRFFYYPKLLRLLYDQNVSVVLKYNFINNFEQDLVAGRKDYTIKRDKVLETLIDYGFNAHKPTRLGLDIIVFNGNVNEILKIHELCRKNNIFPIAGEYIPTGRTANGEFQGHKSLEMFNKKEKSILAKMLQPINAKDRKVVYNKLREYDESIGIKHNSCFAYYGGGICTQILGLYIDIEGNIWPCVARKVNENNRYIEKPLGNFRKGDLASFIWVNNEYINRLKTSFNGGCPYKKSLTSGI